MLKVRNILIIIAVNYAILFFLSVVLEITILNNRAKEVDSVIRISAKMALQQAQVVDENLAYNGRDSYKLTMSRTNGNGFEQVDLFDGVWGIPTGSEANAEAIFLKLYNNEEFKSLASTTTAVTKPIRYYNASKTGYAWYYMPTVAMMGTNILPSKVTTNGVKSVNGAYMSSSLAKEMFADYGVTSYKKTSNGETYYNTPISLGITYLNSSLVSDLFMNNLDLMMRRKYEENLNTPEGGNGVLEGTYADKITGSIETLNPINNGVFTLLRGEKKGGNGQVATYKGVTPKIEYKTIDMYDSANDDILVNLFGANKGSYSSKAEYLKSLDANVTNPVTNQAYKTKPIVVAKVTFYADVIVPYYSVMLREMRGAEAGSNNFLNLVDEHQEGQKGSTRMEYTTYFAVTP